MPKSHLRGGVAALLFAAAASNAAAADTAKRVSADCGICHQLQGPADDSVAARQERKGPPLFYAGNKFREDWLAAWLQSPTRLRPAGDFAPDHVTEMPKGEALDAASLVAHPALDAASAKQIAAYLMTLRPHDALIAKEAYTPGGISERMGAMDFVKFKGCGACHKDTPKYGGVSGPELYTAWQRLQPPFITSYIRDPKAWEPRSLMPNKHLNDGPIHKLANYLRAIGSKSGKAK
jgi:mono/diheme cytochrome c family protein